MTEKTPVTSAQNAPSVSLKRRKAFLRCLAENGGRVVEAARTVGYQSSDYLRRLYRADPDFAKQWDSAIEAAADKLEDEAVRRAVEGVQEPVYYKGEVVGHQNKFSDQLLMFVLKGARPDKFADRKQANVSINANIGVALLPMTSGDSRQWEDDSKNIHTAHKTEQIRMEDVENMTVVDASFELIGATEDETDELSELLS